MTLIQYISGGNAMLYQMLVDLFSAEKEEGQGLVEYALILVLIAIVVIVVLGLLGEEVTAVFSQIVSGLR